MTGRGRTAAWALAALVPVIAIGAGVLVAARTPTPASQGGVPAFVDVTAASGLRHTYGGGYTAFTGGGLAVLDCDLDGRPDLHVAGGDGPAALARNVTAAGGAITFERVPALAAELTGATGSYPLDVDGDGRQDLAVLTTSGLVLLRGGPACTFEDATAVLGLDGIGGWVTAFSATWEGGADLPTLAIGRYQRLRMDGSPTFECDAGLLVRPLPAGGGYGERIPLEPGYCALSMLFSSWDGSLRRDLRVSNDRQYYDPAAGQEQLWRVEPGAPPRPYGAVDGWIQLQVWGMGIASRDLTGDGLPEVYLTSQGDNKLQTLLEGPARPAYRDLAARLGVTAAAPVEGGAILPSTAWHPAFEDVNNDGFTDLYVSKGNVSDQVGYAVRDPSNLFLGAPDGTFTERSGSAGIVDFDRTRGAAISDLDGDGLLDLVEVKLGAPVRVWHNTGSGDTGAGWLGILLRQAGGNRDAVGAIVDVRIGDLVQHREVTVGGGHGSGTAGPIHVGLGPADRADVRVTWPDGTRDEWRPVTGGRVVVVERGTADPVPWAPGS